MLIFPTQSHPKIKQLTEDEVTSTVFGPLTFMSSPEAWQAVLQSGLISKVDMVTAPRNHSIDFWRVYRNPNRASDATWRHRFPDAVFDFDFGRDGKIRLVLEIKWNADQSSSDEDGNGTQLALQWIATNLVARNDGEIIRQAYLTLHRSNAQAALEETLKAKVDGFDRKNWLAASPVSITWMDLSKNLAALGTSSQVGKWAQCVVKFLEVRNVQLFGGFRGIVYERQMRDCTYRFGASPFHWPVPPR